MAHIRLDLFPEKWRMPKEIKPLETNYPVELLMKTARLAWKELIADPEFIQNANVGWLNFMVFLEDVGLPEAPGQFIIKRPGYNHFLKNYVMWETRLFLTEAEFQNYYDN